MTRKILWTVVVLVVVAGLALVFAESRTLSRDELSAALQPAAATTPTSPEDGRSAPMQLEAAPVPDSRLDAAAAEQIAAWERREAELGDLERRQQELADRERQLAAREAEADRQRRARADEAAVAEVIARTPPLPEATEPAPRLPGPAEREVEPARVSYREVPVTLPAGTVLRVELLDAVSSEEAAVGETIRARVADSIFVDRRLAVPVGAEVAGRVVEVRRLKKIGGKPLLAIDFERLEAPTLGSVPIVAFFSASGRSETGRDAATIGGAAAAGAVVGRAVKGRDKSKGGLVGALIGAAVGAAAASQTEGEPILLEPGDPIDLVLEHEVIVPTRVKVIGG